jgi:ferritin-like metal-binding protein YciE
MAITSLQELYQKKLQMIYDAEHQGQQAMPRLLQAARNGDLRSALQAHRQQTEEQVRRLDGLFRSHGQSPERTECRSMRALIQEAEQLLPTIQDDDTRDAFVISAQQAIEHHEIADYGTARTWARQLGFGEDASVLQAILEQERNADKLLSDVAERMVNPEAAAAGDVDVTGRAQPGDRAAASARSTGAGGGRTTSDRGATSDAEPNPLNR